MTVRVTVLFLHVAPLPSPINLLHNDFQRSGGGVSLWVLSPCPVAGIQNKAKFPFHPSCVFIGFWGAGKPDPTPSYSITNQVLSLVPWPSFLIPCLAPWNSFFYLLIWMAPAFYFPTFLSPLLAWRMISYLLKYMLQSNPLPLYLNFRPWLPLESSGIFPLFILSAYIVPV